MLNYHALLELGMSPDVRTLTSRVVSMAEKLGFGLASGVLIRGRPGSPAAAMHAFGNPPDGYLETMNSAGEGLRDPLLGLLLARPGHATYDQKLYVDAGASDLWDAQAPYGFRSGIAVSLHEQSHAEAFLLGLDGLDRVPDGSQRLMLQANLQILAMHAQSALVRLVAEKTGQPLPDLTKIERAAIKTAGAKVLVRRGHLTSISELGGPALHSAARKLGIRKAPDLVLVGVQSGLLHP